jgi:hypothetical protein
MNKFVEKYKKLAESQDVEGITRESMKWYRNVMRNQQTIVSMGAVKGSYKKPRKILAGMMVTYTYSAKTASKLPYWDRYPLVYILEVLKDGWTGINIHYLHPQDRYRLFSDNFFKNRYIENKISTPAMKRYLANRVVGKFVEIPLEDWPIMINLPYEKFVGASKTKVWRDSRRMM